MNIPEKDSGIRKENNLIMESFIQHLHEDEHARGNSGYFGGDAQSTGGPIDDGGELNIDTTSMAQDDTPGQLDSLTDKIFDTIQQELQNLSPDEQNQYIEQLKDRLDELLVSDDIFD